MMKQRVALITSVALGAGMLLAAPALAQAPAPTHADTGLPFCSKSVTDRCVQRVDLVREGKPTTAKKAEKAM